jgi:type I restriction enzyme, S subunit
MMVKEYKIGDFLKRVKNAIEIQDGVLYKRVTIKTNHQGVTLRDQADGSVIGTKNQFTVSGGDFILSKIDARYGAFGIIPEGLDGAIITGNFWTYKVDTAIVDTEWFFYFTHSYSFIQICQESSTGTTHRKYLDEKTFLNHKLTIPDKAEQVRMVKRYLTGSKVSRKCSVEITNQKQLLSQLKQAILQEAIQGKLTADWRAQNPNVEPANELLKRIKADKEKLVKEKKIKKEKPLPPISADEVSFELPEGWVWCRLDDLFDVRSGVTKGKKYVEPLLNIPYLRVANVQRGFLDLSTIKTIEVPISEKEKYLLQSNDLLVTEGGDPDKVGRCSIWNNEVLGCIHQNHIFCLREVTPETLFTSFFPFAINSKFAQKYFLSTNKQTTNLASINKTILRSLPIALPPFDEQCVIYKKTEALKEKCRVLETEITQSEAHAQMLMQAVLKEAFEPAAATELEAEESIAMAAEPAEVFGKQGEFGF